MTYIDKAERDILYQERIDALGGEVGIKDQHGKEVVAPLSDGLQISIGGALSRAANSGEETTIPVPKNGYIISIRIARVVDKEPVEYQLSVLSDSIGAVRVGVDFNPSGLVKVKEIKTHAAHLINEVFTLGMGNKDLSDESKRLQAIAATALEEAAMWCVKAAVRVDSDPDKDF